jgi:hypothetical protein
MYYYITIHRDAGRHTTHRSIRLRTTSYTSAKPDAEKPEADKAETFMFKVLGKRALVCPIERVNNNAQAAA